MSTLLLLLSLLVLASGLRAAPRNVVLFIADDMGQDAGCYGNREVMTPALDQLAREGTMFRNAFCTTASCSASRSVIMTGLQNHATGHYGHAHAEHHFTSYRSVRSLPVILGENGYRTGRIGKYHLAPEPVYQFQQHLEANPWNPVEMANAARAFVANRSQSFFLYFCTLTPHRSGGAIEGHPLQPNPFGNHVQYPEIQDVKYTEMKLTVPPHLPDLPETRAELAQYYQAISRTDAGLARLIEVLKETGQYENTVIIFAADNGMPWPGAKTTMYDPGLKLPLVVRTPDQKNRGVTSEAMISWVDFTPTILDFADVKSVMGPPFRPGDPESQAGGGEAQAVATRRGAPKGAGKKQDDGRVPYEFHGRSFRPTLEGGKPSGWDVVFASHQFHEITMYYPMRMIRTDRYKLVLNLAHQLPYPFASDLYASATWQATLKSERSHYGKRRVNDYIFRPRYELYDLEKDPDEIRNVASDPSYQTVYRELSERLKEYQKKTKDPWFSKYTYE
jgi:N-sulfoglucosamine sulfohydrolase